MHHILVGGNFINLFFAETLVKEKIPFSWYTLGEKVGGHFSGIRFNNRFFDIGMVLLEPGKFDYSIHDTSKAEILKNLVYEYFGEYKLESAEIKTKIRNNFFPDYVISDQCEYLWISNFKSNLSTECPSLKWQSSFFDNISYHDYCINAYSEFYSNYLENFASKISFNGHKILSARYHRNAWLPLYYPNTVSGVERKIQPYPFLKIEKCSIAEVVNKKFQSLLSSQFCNFNDSLLNFEDIIEKHTHKHFYVSCDLGKFDNSYTLKFNACTYQSKINIAVFLADSINLNFDCVNDIDDPEIYRVSFQKFDDNKSYVFVEGAASFPDDEDWVIKAKKYLLINFDVLNCINIYAKSFINSVKLPHTNSEIVLKDISNDLSNKFCNNINFYGLQNGFQALSMNKQMLHARNHWTKLL